MSDASGRDCTVTPGVSSLPFCDICGNRFANGQLLPRSKFCTNCGGELSPWLKKLIATSIPEANPVTPIPNKQCEGQLQNEGGSDDEEVRTSPPEPNVRGGPGRGGSRGTSDGRGKRIGLPKLTPRGGRGRQLDHELSVGQHHDLCGIETIVTTDKEVRIISLIFDLKLSSHQQNEGES